MTDSPELNQSESPEAAERAGLPIYMQMAWRHKSLIALGVVAGAVLGGVYTSLKVPSYQSTAQIIVTKKQASPLPASEADPRAFFYEDYLSTHQTLIKSPMIVQRAVQKKNLNQLRSFQGVDDPTGIIRASLNVSRDNKDASTPSNNVLTLSFGALVAADCPIVLDAIIGSYRSYLDEKYKNVSEDTLMQMIRATATLEEELSAKKKTYAEFRAKNELVYWKGKEGVSLQEEWLGQIEAERLHLELQRAKLQGRLDAIEKALKEGRGREALLAQLTPSTAKGSGAEPKLDEQLLDLMIKEQMLLAEYGQEHPDVAAVNKRIALVRDFFMRGAGKDKDGKALPLDPVELRVRSLKQELADLNMSLASLKTLTETEKKPILEIARFRSEAMRNEEDIIRLQRMLEPYVQRLSELRLIRDLGGFDAEVIAPPLTGRRLGAGAAQHILLGGILGLFAGFGLAYLAEVTDRSFRTPEEIRRRLGLSVIGHIPQLVSDAQTQKAIAEGAGIDEHMCTYHRPSSIAAEAFRGVRNNLYFSTHGESHKIIQVTSPNVSDGKSTVAANLAISIAQSGKKILLIDGDFRKPRLHKIFGVSATSGLAAVCAGEDELQDVILPTAVAGLSLLPCGPLPSNPSELLTSPRFKELIDFLRDQYDFVIVDTPPVLAVSDPNAVAPRVDGVLLVIKVSKNGRPDAERAKQMLQSLQVNVLGVIVNRVGGEEYGYQYESSPYGYHYGYHQGYYAEEEGTQGADGTAAPPAAGAPGSKAHSGKKKATLLRRITSLWTK